MANGEPKSNYDGVPLTCTCTASLSDQTAATQGVSGAPVSIIKHSSGLEPNQHPAPSV